MCENINPAPWFLFELSKVFGNDERTDYRCPTERHLYRVARRQKLVEYQHELREASFSVGNIYLAKVKKLMPGLNACFVDVGYERDAFLHFLDLGSQFGSYVKYLKQVQSDRKRLYPITKATRLPDMKKTEACRTRCLSDKKYWCR